MAKGWTLSAFAGRCHSIFGHQGSTAILPHWFTLVKEGKNDNKKTTATDEALPVPFLKRPQFNATSPALFAIKPQRSLLRNLLSRRLPLIMINKIRKLVLCWANLTSPFFMSCVCSIWEEVAMNGGANLK